MHTRRMLLGLLLVGFFPLYAADQESGLSMQESSAHWPQVNSSGAGALGTSQQAQEERAAKLKYLLEYTDKSQAVRNFQDAPRITPSNREQSDQISVKSTILAVGSFIASLLAIACIPIITERVGRHINGSGRAAELYELGKAQGQGLMDGLNHSNSSYLVNPRKSSIPWIPSGKGQMLGKGVVFRQELGVARRIRVVPLSNPWPMNLI